MQQLRRGMSLSPNPPSSTTCQTTSEKSWRVSTLISKDALRSARSSSNVSWARSHRGVRFGLETCTRFVLSHSRSWVVLQGVNLPQELVDITNTIRNDAHLTQDLKEKVDQAVQDTIVATRIIEGFKNPQSGNTYLKDHASFPLEYFTRVTEQMSQRLAWYKSTIEVRSLPSFLPGPNTDHYHILHSKSNANSPLPHRRPKPPKPSSPPSKRNTRPSLPSRIAPPRSTPRSRKSRPSILNSGGRRQAA